MAKGPTLNFEELVDAAPVGIAVVDRKGAIYYVNPQLARTFGYERRELLGKAIEMLVPQRFHELLPGLGKKQAASPASRTMGTGQELFGVRQDGGEFPVEIGLNPLDAPNGQLVMVSVVDISERKKTDEARLRLAAIVDSSDDAIVGKTLDGIVTSWNFGAERIFGYKSHEIIGKSITLLIPQDRLAEEPQIIARLRAGERIEHFETVRRRKDGKEIHLSLTISPIKDDRGAIVGASKIARDISDRKFAEMSLRQLSTPVLQVRERLLILPIIGIIDPPRARQLTEQLLRSIRSNRAKVVVIDVTGVPAMDGVVANHLVSTVSSARLLGATVIMTGVSAEIAQTLVSIGVDLEKLNTLGDLQGGIEEAGRLLGQKVDVTAEQVQQAAVQNGVASPRSI